MSKTQTPCLKGHQGGTKEAWATRTNGAPWTDLTQRYWAYLDALLDVEQEDGALDYFQDVLDMHQEELEKEWGIRIVYPTSGRTPTILGTGVLDGDTLSDEYFWEDVPVTQWVQEAYQSWALCGSTDWGQEA